MSAGNHTGVSHGYPLICLDNVRPSTIRHSVAMTNGWSLDERLVAAGVVPGTDPVDAWRRLHENEGPRATVIDLYQLVARLRGLEAHELPLHERMALARSVMPAVWPGFEQTSGSERSGDAITVVDYDPEWPRRYERWHEILRSHLGDTALRIEHVGSTSIPGLEAKPIVDIQVSVADIDDEPTYVALLEQVGVQLRSRDDLHRYFRPFPGQPRDVHVHICNVGSEWERHHVVFRDYLRAHPEARDAYAKAKRRAAATWADDGIAYTDAKTDVILTILDDAERWSATAETPS